MKLQLHHTLSLISALLTIFFLSSTLSAQAPEDCENGRYTLGIQYNFEVSMTDELYGTNVDAAGDEIALQMTIYTPKDDVVEERPVVILGFGGAFITGARENLHETCQLLALQGIVAVTIDYRIYPIGKLGYPGVEDIYDTAIKAVGDMKAAVRHIRKLVDNGNPYNMDADRIMVGGVSAGAVVALHAATLSADDEIDGLIGDIIEANGGLEGNTGDASNLSYSSEVSGVINLSGALLDTLFLTRSDSITINSMHGTDDETVPFGFGYALNFIPMYGSSLVHQRAINQGLNSHITVVQGGGHTDIYIENQYENDRTSFFMDLGETFQEVFCGKMTASQNAIFKEMSVFPNPASTRIAWNTDFNTDRVRAGIYDQLGNLVLNQTLIGGNSLDISSFVDGVYYLIIKPLDGPDIQAIYQTKFVKTK